MTTALEVVYQEAEALNVAMDDYMANYILWEETGFPGFWDPYEGQSHEDCLRHQVRLALKDMPKKRGPSVWKHLVQQD